MIDILQLKKDFGGTVILNGITVRFGQNAKIGLIGRNGAGKTTLLRILSGEDRDYSGKISRSGDVRLGYVSQHFPEFEGTALDFILEPFVAMQRTLEELESAMSMAEGRKLDAVLARYGQLRAEYDGADGDGAQERARRYLDELGIADRCDTSVKVLSGGEKNVLSLARALLAHPDFLILDEPGNHLDIWGLSWLEGFIRDYPGTVLVVSHNRYLLDRTVSRIIELERGAAAEFAGNYSAYRMEKLRRTVAGGMAWRADQKKIAQLEETVRRFAQIARVNPDPAWGRRLRARRTHLEKTIENSAERPDDPDSSFTLKFDADRSRADIALKVTEFTCGYGERILLDRVSLLVEPGERVALVGPNGCGKTTFLDAVMRESSRDGRTIRVGESMKVAYCSQHGDGIDRQASVLDACVAAGSRNLDEAWKVLSRFLFSREALTLRASALSGGEINRLQLALAVIARANFLVLDEPTNHLDIASCEAVEDALCEFSGTILVVSHDRYFLDRVATRIVEIDGSDFVEHDGNFSEFWYRKYGSRGIAPFATGRATSAAGRAATIARSRDGSKAVEGKEEAARGRTDRTGHSGAQNANGGAKAADAIEKRIVALEAERERLERELTAAYGAGDLKKARALGSSLAETGTLIERLYADWK